MLAYRFIFRLANVYVILDLIERGVINLFRAIKLALHSGSPLPPTQRDFAHILIPLRVVGRRFPESMALMVLACKLGSFATLSN